MTDQLGLFSVPEQPLDPDEHARAYARRSDPATSHAAAASITPARLRESQLAVLGLFASRPRMHDDHMLSVYLDTATLFGGIPMQSPSGLRTRRRELVDLGYLEDSGERVALPSGRQSIVWQRTRDAAR